MRTERDFDLRKTFYALRTFKWEGRLYNRGDKFPSRDVTKRKLKVMFQNGRVGYSTDFRTNKTDRKQVEIEDSSDDSVESKATPEVADKTEGKAEESETVEVVQDDEEAFRVSYKGKTFEVSRNQVRKDGTLTAGGLKAYEQA